MLTLSGCVGRKKYARILEEELGRMEVDAPPAPGGGWLSVDLSDTLNTNQQVEAIHAKFIPALLYWGWNSTLDCRLPAPVVAEWFRDGAVHAADSLGVATPEPLVVRIEQVPNDFIFTDRGSILILVLAYSTSELEGIIPGEQPLRITYSRRDQETGEALFSPAIAPAQNPGSSTRKFTRRYLETLRRSVRQSATEWVTDALVR